jgi:predicted phosphodiesterase
MTRLAVLADIHGNWPALEAVLVDVTALGIEDGVVAGDVVTRGLFSAEVLDAIEATGWPVIRGNNEDNLLAFTRRGTSREGTSDETLALTAEQLGPARIDRLAAWPDEIALQFPDAPALRMVHGWPGSATGYIHQEVPDDETLLKVLAGVQEPVVIAGHVHRTVNRQIGRWRVFNPGAVGMPFDGDQQASYLVLEGSGGAWRPIFRRVAYDVDRVLAAYARLDFVARFGTAARWIVEEVRQARPLAGPYQAWLAEHYPGVPMSVSTFEAFLADPDRGRFAYYPYQIDVDETQEGLDEAQPG